MSSFTIEDRPIEGDITKRNRNVVEQKTPAEFLAALDVVLDLPGVEAVRWQQYTPYFNDGEPCEFNVYDFLVRIVGDADDSGDYEDGFRSSLYDYGKHTTYADRPRDNTYNYRWGTPEYEKARAAERAWSDKYFAADNRIFLDIPGGSAYAIEEALGNLNRQSSAFEAVLESSFGDHAEVTATKAGFNVEYYEHD
jgi:hypothetical protein